MDLSEADSLETAPEKELDRGPEKEVDVPPKGVMVDEEPPNGVRLWLKFPAPDPDDGAGAGFCWGRVGSGP